MLTFCRTHSRYELWSGPRLEAWLAAEVVHDERHFYADKPWSTTIFRWLASMCFYPEAGRQFANAVLDLGIGQSCCVLESPDS